MGLLVYTPTSYDEENSIQLIFVGIVYGRGSHTRWCPMLSQIMLSWFSSAGSLWFWNLEPYFGGFEASKHNCRTPPCKVKLANNWILVIELVILLWT